MGARRERQVSWNQLLFVNRGRVKKEETCNEGIASNDDTHQPDAKDKLKEAFAAAKVQARSKSRRVWGVLPAASRCAFRE